MNRKLRRMMERQQQKEQTIKMTPAEKHEIVDKAMGAAYTHILPIMMLYLMENFRCREKGLEKFMSWFNDTLRWIDEDPRKLKQIAGEVKEKTGIELSW